MGEPWAGSPLWRFSTVGLESRLLMVLRRLAASDELAEPLGGVSSFLRRPRRCSPPNGAFTSKSAATSSSLSKKDGRLALLTGFATRPNRSRLSSRPPMWELYESSWPPAPPPPPPPPPMPKVAALPSPNSGSELPRNELGKVSENWFNGFTCRWKARGVVLYQNAEIEASNETKTILNHVNLCNSLGRLINKKRKNEKYEKQE